jgi:hypothetical protein
MLNLSSLETKDNLPETKLPHVWLGFIFVFLFFASEIIEAFQGYERIGPFTLLSSLGGMIFWLFCVYRFHKVLNEMNSSYPISPGEAVGKHFIPFYNFTGSLRGRRRWRISFERAAKSQSFQAARSAQCCSFLCSSLVFSTALSVSRSFSSLACTSAAN